MSNDILWYGARHGRTRANDKNIYRSWSNAPEAQLSPEGRQDAREIGGFFDHNQIHIALIIADELDRTIETAKIVAQILGIKEILTTPKLHPLHMGDYTLKSKDEYPVEPFLKDPTKKIPGGESVNEFNTRQIDAFSTVLKKAQELKHGFVLVVGHGSNNSFLNNQLYNRDGGQKIGYEGLVNPGGVTMATDSHLCPLTNIRRGTAGIKNFALPPNHQPGMAVPKGGSSCASCEYFKGDMKCGQPDFIKWNGSDKIPAKSPDEYCSDWWESATEEKTSGKEESGSK